MAFTGRLGAVLSRPGNIQLGNAGIVATVVASVPQLPFFTGGPWMPGDPWSRLPIMPRVSVPLAPLPPPIRTDWYPYIRDLPPIKGAPWLQFGPIAPLPQIAPPPPPVPALPLPFFVGGPWMPGMPWSRFPVFPPPPNPTPQPVVQRPQLPMAFPAPMLGMPWSRFQALMPTPPPPKPAPPIPPKVPSTIKPFLARDPSLEPRLRRITDALSSIINSLVGKGLLVQTGPNDWDIPGAGTSGGLTETFP